MARDNVPPPGAAGPQGTDAPFSFSKDGVDPMLVGSLTVLFLALGFIIWRLLKLQWDEKDAKQRTEALRAMMDEDTNDERAGAQMAGGRRRNVRRRVNHDEGDFLDHMMGQQAGEEGAEDFDDEEGAYYEGGEKVGKRKAAKMAAKEEKKAMREYELREREDRKRREAEKEKKRDEEREKEKEEEEAEEERLRKEREEKERKEEEEYQKMKAAFAVEEEGYDEVEGEEAENLMKNFIDFVKSSKVVSIDELAAHFRLKSSQAVDRLQSFLDNGQLEGVMDDRGKFICITPEELHAVAKFVNQRGRVSIQELAEYSNKLVRLEGASE